MGLYSVHCPSCSRVHVWFSGNMDQRCEECKKPKEVVIGYPDGETPEVVPESELSSGAVLFIEKSAFDFQCKQVKEMAETFNKSCSYYQEQIRELQTQVNIEKAEVSRLLAMIKRRNKTR